MEVVGYITTVIVVLVLAIGVVSLGTRATKRTLGNGRFVGALIPRIDEGLDLAKRYDITCNVGDYASTRTERLSDVRIVGYVGGSQDEGKVFDRSRWLAVECVDGRRAYLLPHSIVTIQEAAVVRS